MWFSIAVNLNRYGGLTKYSTFILLHRAYYGRGTKNGWQKNACRAQGGTTRTWPQWRLKTAVSSLVQNSPIISSSWNNWNFFLTCSQRQSQFGMILVLVQLRSSQISSSEIPHSSQNSPSLVQAQELLPQGHHLQDRNLEGRILQV